jgi:alpha-amylase
MAAHDYDIQVIADMVFNHNSGADATEFNPINGQARWTLFNPKSGKFARNWECFHPSSFETWDDGTFGDMPDLSHRNPYVFGEVLKLARWLVEEIGFDGFRYDFVKGYGPWIVTAIQEYRYVRDGQHFKPYGVGENWDGPRTIENWINETNAWNDNEVDAFDFPLREMLKALCDSFGFDMHWTTTWDTFLRRAPESTVTFVENHDLRDGDRPIFHDKLLAYGYILTHEGYPCVFWKDYYNYGLAQAGTPNGIAALVDVHEKLARGPTDVLHVDRDLYIMERRGFDGRPGLVFALNNRGDGWNGTRVNTQWRSTSFRPVAWWSGSDLARPSDQWTHADGSGQFWAPPRGYAVYAPQV